MHLHVIGFQLTEKSSSDEACYLSTPLNGTVSYSKKKKDAILFYNNFEYKQELWYVTDMI